MVSTGCYTYSYDINFDGYITNHEEIINITKVTKCFITYHTVESYTENRKPTRVKVKDDGIWLERCIPLKKLVKTDDKVFDKKVENLQLFKELVHSTTWTDERFIKFISLEDDEDMRKEYIKFNKQRFSNEEDFQHALNN